MRVRLTALYTTMFLGMSTILLVVVNLFLDSILKTKFSDFEPAPPRPVGPPPRVPDESFQGKVIRLPEEVLDYQWTVTAIALTVLPVLSVAAGWWLAGRMLRPLRRITATAQRLSLSNLHERIALTGPDDELKELADTFDAMLARLERSVDSQRRFIANAAHELRTPLATQRAAIQIGLEDATDLADVREKLLTHNKRNEVLIDSLLVLAQAEHGLDEVQPVELDQLTRQAVRDVAADGIAITVDARPARVLGDPVLLNRLLANLLHNAVRYNRPDGTVHIGLTVTGTLTVSNTGPEVPPERVPELFQPFRRLHTRTRADGAGLGLSIVASIAQAHHAELAARPNRGGGLELTVRFPILGSSRSSKDAGMSIVGSADDHDA